MSKRVKQISRKPFLLFFNLTIPPKNFGQTTLNFNNKYVIDQLRRSKSFANSSKIFGK
ncbi:hypothetical protein BDF21DRAFT_490754, partial [Thamnidium elegans]